MVHELTSRSLEESLHWADVIAIGPGLGLGEWGKMRYARRRIFANRWSGMRMR